MAILRREASRVGSVAGNDIIHMLQRKAVASCSRSFLQKTYKENVTEVPKRCEKVRVFGHLSVVSYLEENKGMPYIIISNIAVREVEIIKEDEEFCTVRILSTGAGIRVRKTRIFETRRELEEKLGISRSASRPGSWGRMPLYR